MERPPSDEELGIDLAAITADAIATGAQSRLAETIAAIRAHRLAVLAEQNVSGEQNT